MSQPRQRDEPGASPLALELIPGRYAVCHLPAGDPIPAWALSAGGLTSITRTDRELSIVTGEAQISQPVKAERGFMALRVIGTLDFNLVGVLATLTAALAAAAVPVFVISTFETDYLLVKTEHGGRAIDALARVARIVT